MAFFSLTKIVICFIRITPAQASRRRIRDGQDEVYFDQQLRRFVQKSKPPPDPNKPPDFSVDSFYVRPASHKRGAAAAARAAAERASAAAKAEFDTKVKEIEEKKKQETDAAAEQEADAMAAKEAAKKEKAEAKKKVAQGKRKSEAKAAEEAEAAEELSEKVAAPPAKRGRSNAPKVRYREREEDDLGDDSIEEEVEDEDSYGGKGKRRAAQPFRRSSRRVDSIEDESSRDRPRRR